MLKAVLATDGGRGRDPFQPLHPGWPPSGPEAISQSKRGRPPRHTWGTRLESLWWRASVDPYALADVAPAFAYVFATGGTGAIVAFDSGSSSLCLSNLVPGPVFA